MNIYKASLTLLAGALIAGCNSSSSSDPETPPETRPHPVLHMLGDSTMRDYTGTDQENIRAGWGEKMHMFFNDDLEVKNWAMGGRSSRSFFYEDVRWPAAKADIQTGDYVIIQFAHNDQKKEGDTNWEDFWTFAYCPDGTTNGESCQDTDRSYYQFLKKYVLETRQQGGIPVLVTPIVRNYTTDGVVNEKGQHNLTEVYDGEDYARGNYTQAMKDVAEAYNVPLIDMTADSKEIVDGYGSSSAALLFDNDSTHPNPLFATLLAKQGVQGLSELDILTEYMIDSQMFFLSQNEMDFGNKYLDVPSTQMVNVSALDLEESTGSIVVSAPEGYLINNTSDVEDNAWANNWNIDFTNSAFTETLHIKFTPVEAKEYTGNVSFTLSGAELALLPVFGSGVEMGNGTPSSVSWFSKDNANKDTSPVIEGLLVGEDAMMTDNIEFGSNNDFPLNGGETITAVRIRVDGHASQSDDVYVQVEVKALQQDFSIDTIAANLAKSGGNNVSVLAKYSHSADFSNPVNLGEIALDRDALTTHSFPVAETVKADDSFYVRFYPWNNNKPDETGKYLAIHDMRIEGLSGE